MNDLFYFSYLTILTEGFSEVTPKTWIGQKRHCAGGLYGLYLLAGGHCHHCGRGHARQEKSRCRAGAEIINRRPAAGGGCVSAAKARRRFARQQRLRPFTLAMSCARLVPSPCLFAAQHRAERLARRCFSRSPYRRRADPCASDLPSAALPAGQGQMPGRWAQPDQGLSGQLRADAAPCPEQETQLTPCA